MRTGLVGHAGCARAPPGSAQARRAATTNARRFIRAPGRGETSCGDRWPGPTVGQCHFRRTSIAWQYTVLPCDTAADSESSTDPSHMPAVATPRSPVIDGLVYLCDGDPTPLREGGVTAANIT